MNSRRFMCPLRTRLVECLKPSTLRPGGEGEMPHNRSQTLITPDVRFGSKADICSAIDHVCFTPKSDSKCGKWKPDFKKRGRA
jgi:hypothetical protein